MLKNIFNHDHGRSELEHIDYLDGWRGLAISLVLVAHFLLTSSELARMGVDVFFVLSGLLMSKILFVKRTDLKTFYKRRISRVFPVFVLFVVLFYSVSFFQQQNSEWKNILYTLSFLRSYFPSDASMWHTGIPVGHLWSLNVEEHSYVLLSLLTLLPFMRGREYWILIPLALFSIFLQAYIEHYLPEAANAQELQTHFALSHLMLSAGYFLIRDKFAPWVKGWMPIVALLATSLLYTDFAPWYFSWMFSPFLLAFAVNHLSQTYHWFKEILCFKPLRMVGIWSYSIYLWQQPFYFYWVKNIHSSVWLDAFSLLMAVFCGVVSFYAFENPVRKWINNNW